jgi:hypothetical protein
MRTWRSLFPLIGVITLLSAPFCVSAQTGKAASVPAEASDAGTETGPVVFSLIPLLEAAFNGELSWRPDWPADIPVDGFALSPEKSGSSLGIVLSNGVETYTLKRNVRGRLTEFPCFSQGACLQVKAAYGVSGEVLSMIVNAGDGSSQTGNTAAQTWDIVFPPDFFPCDDNPPGGTFPPVRVSRGETAFFVVWYESPAFLSETWYDEAGNMSAYFKAPVRWENGRWRALSLQTWDAAGMRSEDYFFDGSGCISEVRSPDGRFSALYRNNRPRYWERQPSGGEETAAAQMALQWDERGFPASLRFEDAAPADVPSADSADAPVMAESPPLEYRYEYELDIAGNWIKRQDIAIIRRFGVLAPRLERSWTRQIEFTGD